mmetsp:Transcript_25550/g.51231  ORF Transcript_25550/g.51231 Transcript_25550/m.51231 type:complete len:173 (-) Transcript_25550:9-527(-)
MEARNRYLSIDLMHYSTKTSLEWQMVTTSLECNSKRSILAILKMVTGRRFLTVGKNSLDVKIRLQNEAGEGHFVRKLVTVKDGKIATSMEYTATLASLYVQESSRKLTVLPATRPKYYHSGSTIVECTVASDRTTDQRDQMRRFFIEKNAAARRAFHNLRRLTEEVRPIYMQ